MKIAKQYCFTEVAGGRKKSGKVILTFLSNDECCGYCAEDEYRLSALLPIREELTRGDLRSLYIGWLLGVQTGRVELEDTEPPVPPNLDALSGPQETMAEFLRLERHLLAVAARNSPAAAIEVADRQKVFRWIASLPAAEKDEILFRVMMGEEAKLSLEFKSRFHKQQKQGASRATTKRRTAAELLEAAGAYASNGRGRKKQDK